MHGAVVLDVEPEDEQSNESEVGECPRTPFDETFRAWRTCPEPVGTGNQAKAPGVRTDRHVLASGLWTTDEPESVGTGNQTTDEPHRASFVLHGQVFLDGGRMSPSW